jgi:hypothetical protein
MLGPLYHLTEKEERVAALVEARRVAKPAGIIVCGAISRYAFLEDIYFHEAQIKPNTVERIISHLKNGQLRNPTETPGSFTTAYAHLPEELEEEIRLAGLSVERLIDFDTKWQDGDFQQSLFEMIRLVESDRTLLGMSGHILAIAQKKG